MLYTQGSIITTLQAVQRYLITHADQLGGVATSGASRKIDEVTASLDANGREQEERALAARMATVKRITARHALIKAHMQPIAHVAAAELSNYGELTALHMPRLNVNDQVLIQKARAMASAASDHEPAFSQGLASDDFAADLERAADRLTAAGKERADAVGSRQNATAGLAADARIARKRLRVIDCLVKAAIKNDPPLVVEWNAARKIAKKPGHAHALVTAEDTTPGNSTIAITAPSPSTMERAA